MNLPVARAVAAWYRGRGVPHDDLEQVARVALVTAAQRFDPDRGHDFLSYAVPTMRGAVQRYFRDQGWTVRPPRLVQELQVRALDAAAVLQEGTGGVPGLDALARYLDEPREAVEEALAARGCFTPASLDRPTREDGVTLGDLLPGEDDGLAAAEARVALRPVVRALSERERRVLYLRFFEQRSQQEIADRLGTSQMHVSRLLRRTLTRLRDDLGDRLGEAV